MWMSSIRKFAGAPTANWGRTVYVPGGSTLLERCIACPSHENGPSVPKLVLSNAKSLSLDRPGPSSPTPSTRIRTLHQLAKPLGPSHTDSAVSVTSRIDGVANLI